jgi:NADPH:quinone reductase-like Zn-dependent oxidoreductase
VRAWRIQKFGGVESLVLDNVPVPEPKASEVVLEVRYAGVNPVDRSTISGRFDWIGLPHIPGSEFSGVVRSLGEDVDSVSSGDRVVVMPKLFCGRCHYCVRGDESLCLENPRMRREPYIVGVYTEGGWAEFAKVPVSNVFRIPDDLSFEQATTVAVDGFTAWHMFERARPSMGDTVAVVGAAGGVGSFLVQLAHLAGCQTVAIVSNSPQAEAVIRLGADHVVNRSERVVVKGIKEITHERGADVVFDPLGSTTWSDSISSLAPGGRYVTCGVLTGSEVALSLLELYSMQFEIVGSTTGSRKDFIRALEAMSRGKIKGLIDSVFPFIRVREALSRLSQHGRRGKVLMQVPETGQ